ncbi:MAG: hypothetical protein QNJ91_10205 [Gammaproteobacteria bacterium]|nr:hypothetical protein [Gammaproteobacteria bacterium]
MSPTRRHLHRATHRLTRHAVVALGCAALSGCAAFNDVVVVDVGDQFHVIDSDGPPSPQRLHDAAGNGFECTFSARSTRASLFARDKTVDGKIRCEPLAPAAR